MSLFNYEGCKYCKNSMNNNKVELSKLLPVNVCNKICEYNVSCYKCRNLLKKEDEFFKNRTGGVMSRIEKQIFFISHNECKVFNNFIWGRELKEMKKEIDYILDNPKVKEKYFKCKILLQATKSWAKKDIHIIASIHNNIDDVSNLRRLIRDFIEDRVYTFRNIDFDMVDILRCLITECVNHICKKYIDYMCKKEINRFIKDLFP